MKKHLKKLVILIIVAGIAFLAWHYHFRAIYDEATGKHDEQSSGEHSPAIENLPTGVLKRVIDGDTFLVLIDGKLEKVRILNIDCPESVHPDRSRNTELGETISDRVKKAMPPGTQVYLEKEPGGQDRDRYNRLLRHVHYRLETFVVNYGLFVVLMGFSKYYTKYGRSKLYDAEFQSNEKKAKEALRGVWGR